MKTLFKVFGVILVILVGIYIGGFVFVNFIQKEAGLPPSPPSIGRAQYEVYIKANRRTLYSSAVNQVGSVVTLTNYYALDGKKYRYYKLPLVLDEKYFGDIEVTKR